MPHYRVTLTQEERQELEAISTKGKRAARTIIHARALLLLDAGVSPPMKSEPILFISMDPPKVAGFGI